MANTSASDSKNSQKQGESAKKLTDRLMVYGSFRPDQYPEYVAAFKRMLSEFGEQRVMAGLMAAIDATPEFTPSPARIRQHIPREHQQRPTCPKCVDFAGWVPCLVRHKLSGITEKGVKLCDHQ